MCPFNTHVNENKRKKCKMDNKKWIFIQKCGNEKKRLSLYSQMKHASLFEIFSENLGFILVSGLHIFTLIAVESTTTSLRLSRHDLQQESLFKDFIRQSRVENSSLVNSRFPDLAWPGPGTRLGRKKCANDICKMARLLLKI